MTHDDDRLLERFDQRLSGIEVEVPAPPRWSGSATTLVDPLLPRYGLTWPRLAWLLVAVAVLASLGGSQLLGNRPTTDPAASGAFAVEPVEPGVVRVLHDGEREISWVEGRPLGPDATPPYPDGESRIHVLADGRVWLLMHGSAFELGTQETYEFHGGPVPMTGGDRYAIATDGTMLKLMGWRPQSWTPGRHELWMFGGSEWAPVELPDDGRDGATRGHGVAVGPDDEFWFFATHGTYRFDDGQWTQVTDDSPGHGGAAFVVDADGVPWVLGGGVTFSHLDEGEWVASRPAGTDPAWPLGRVYPGPTADMNASGVIWVQAGAVGTPPTPFLARRMDGEWRVFTDFDHMPEAFVAGSGVALRVAPDGTVWMGSGPDEDDGCDGLAHFDGSTWVHFLDGLCIYDLDVAADGRAWVTGGPRWDETDTAGGLYIVGPVE